MKPTVTYQHLDSSPCYPYNRKNSVSYSQVERLNRICCNNAFYDQGYDKLVYSIHEEDTIRVVRQEILKARK